MNLDGKSLKGNFIRYIIPSILAQWVYSLYSMVDGMFVAKGVNEIALTAVNLSYPFVAFLFALSLLFAVGLPPLSRYCWGRTTISGPARYLHRILFCR